MIDPGTYGRWIDACALLAILFYVAAACVVYLVTSGDLPGFFFNSFIAAIFWPFALIWWGFNWIGAVIAVGLMYVGLKRAMGWH